MSKEDALRFLLAGLSCSGAACVTNPIDVVKIRMQLDGELQSSAEVSRKYNGFIKGGCTIAKEEGVLALYKGLTASLLREASYSTIRLGAYEPLKRALGATDPRSTPLWKKIAAGAISGAMGSSLATPTDLVKVRLQASLRSPRYSSTLGAFAQIYRSEGLRGLYVGIGPTVQRATILTATQIPAYDHTKHVILNNGLMSEGVPLHVVSSMVAGMFCALTTSPIDLVKTRMMRQKQSERHYKSTWECIVKTAQAEGPLGFYKGFFPNWMRIGPHTVVTFFIFEKLRKIMDMAPV